MLALPGAAFTEASDGDQRLDHEARRTVARRLDIPAEWATVRQVHGAEVRVVREPGDHGEADALFTTRPGLPLAVFTADCLGIVVLGDAGVAVAHAGWRGLSAGVLERVVEVMEREGVEVREAIAGPAIGPCCFEVGPEVAALFPDHLTETRWGTTSVDLYAAAEDRLGMRMARSGECTRCGPDAFSHRRDASTERMAAIGWLVREEP